MSKAEHIETLRAAHPGQRVRVEWKDMSIASDWEEEDAFRFGVLVGMDEGGGCLIRYLDGDGEKGTAPPEIVFLDESFYDY